MAENAACAGCLTKEMSSFPLLERAHDDSGGLSSTVLSQFQDLLPRAWAPLLEGSLAVTGQLLPFCGIYSLSPVAVMRLPEALF